MFGLFLCRFTFVYDPSRSWFDLVYFDVQVFPPEQEWVRGQPIPLPQVTAGVCAKVVEMLLNFMADDHDSQVMPK